jgi:hypothetical protein
MSDRGGADGAEQPVTAGVFRWETLRIVEPCVLPYENPIYGVTVEVELVSGMAVKCFRADDGRFYFCHGLTFGGADAPGGAVSPYSRDEVGKILAGLHEEIADARAAPGDVLVWYGANGEAIHSAIVVLPVALPNGKVLDYATVVRSKNGRRPAADTTLRRLVDDPDGYGESYRAYRRK